MELDIVSASKRLSELELSFVVDDMKIEIFWYRAMVHESQWFIDRHKHSTFEFHFIALGQCKVIHDEGEFVVSSGELYITAPGVYHTQCNFGDDRLVEYCINCDLQLVNDGNGESQHIIELLKDYPCEKIKDTNNVIQLFEMVLHEAYWRRLGFYNNIKALTALIIGTVTRNLSSISSHEYQVPLKKGKDHSRLDQIRRYIEDNISDSITAIGIANHMFLSERQVCRIIKSLTGNSTKEYIAGIKFQRAKDMLKATNMTIKEISEHLGFSSEYYFNQFFKNIEGYPPGIFRTQTRNV